MSICRKDPIGEVMVTSRVEGETYFQIDNENFHLELTKIILSIIPTCKKIIKKRIYFYFLSSFILFIELFFIIFFSQILIDNSFFAFSIATIFLTAFSFFILRIYIQAQKNEQFNAFIKRYGKGCKTFIKYREGIPEHHIALANAYSKLSGELTHLERHLFSTPKWIGSLRSSIENFSSWCFCEDIFQIRESLLESAIQEHLKLVKCEPTSLDVHAALANAYVVLSGIYLQNLRELCQEDSSKEEDLKNRFRETAQKAIEEFKILNDYAPNDPWVHTQLAYSYKDLNMPIEEIAEYETILRLRPDDHETLYKLGCLYFQEGRNSEGLRIYEKMKQINFKKAEQLIAYYGGIKVPDNLLFGNF